MFKAIKSHLFCVSRVNDRNQNGYMKKQTRGQIVVLGIELMLIKSSRFLLVRVLTPTTCLCSKKPLCVRFD